MLPAIAEREAGGRGRRLHGRHRLRGGADRPRVRGGQALGLPVKLHADQLSNLGGAALAARYGALSADHLEHTDEAGAAAMAEAGTVAVLLPGAFYFIRETRKPPVELFRQHGMPIAIATDSNPGSSPLTSLLLTMNMAATLFRLTVDEIIAGVTREAARALGRRRDGTLEAGKWCDLAIWDVERLAELPYRMGFNPLHAARVEGPVSLHRRITAGSARSAWTTGARLSRRRRRGSIPPARPRRGQRPRRRRHRRQGRARLRHQHRLRQTRQRAHRGRRLARCSATSCCRMPPASASRRRAHVVRLMLALKLASLARAPPACARDDRHAGSDAGERSDPGGPGQGSVGASGDLAPLAHMAPP